MLRFLCRITAKGANAVREHAKQCRACRRTVAWFIESAAGWWDGSSLSAYAFTMTANDALRFARQQDAEKIISWLFPSGISPLLKTTEHVWLDTSEESDESDELTTGQQIGQ